MVHYITYFNISHEETNGGYWPDCRLTLHFYLFFVVINLIQSLYFIQICIRAKQFPSNWNTILAFLLLVHILHCFTIIFQRIINIYFDEIFLYVSILRLFFLTIEFFILGTFMLERLLAFIYLESYDYKNYVPHVLIGFLVVFAAAFSITFHMIETSFFHLGAVLLINILSAVANKLIKKVNKRLQLAINKPNSGYSLSQRYQIYTNIRIYRMVRKMVNTIAISNFFLALFLMIDNFEMNMTIRSILAIVFDISVLVTNFILIKIISETSPMWRRVVRKNMQKMFQSYSNNSKITVERPPTITGSLGTELRTTHDASLHFYNLQKYWDESG